MNDRKPSLWLVTSILLIILGGLALLPGASTRSALAQPPLVPDGPAEVQASAANSDPVSITVDEDGYTTWTYDYSYDREAFPNFCWPYSRIRWPFDLGAQDPTELSETTLIFTFAQMRYVSDYTDPTWGVSLNSFPKTYAEGYFPTEGWNIIGAIGTEPASSRYSERIIVEHKVPFDHTELIDGENNIYFRQSDFCPLPELWDSACTCYDLFSIKLRAQVKLGVKEVSPAPDARNVWPEQHTDSEIGVIFTTLVSETTVNEETFTVIYHDEDANQVPVAGEIQKRSETEFVFVPDEPLMPGVRYLVQVWGKDEALMKNRKDWVKDLAGGPLETGRTWLFWTMPELQVTVKPVQILEGMNLIAGRSTVVRTFIRWDLQPGVHIRSQVPKVEVDDISLIWIATEGVESGVATWRDGAQWEPAHDPQSARRKREYREETFAEESYTEREKWYALDSVNYYGFTPPSAGGYQLTARVLVNDNHGRARPFTGRVTVNAGAVNNFNVMMRAVAVGADYGKSGTVNLSAPINTNLNGLRAIFPIAGLSGPAAPSAMAYYSPTTTLWFYDWSTEPAGGFPKQYLLQEMSALCQRTTGCRAMVGFTSSGWLGDLGLTLPGGAPWGALVRDDIASNRYIVAHELGHLAGFEHLTIPAGEGFDVRRRSDMRNSVHNDIFDFMDVDPVASMGKQLWIAPSRYTTLALWTGATSLRAASASPAQSSELLLLVSGVITESTGETLLLPWYQMAPGEWQPPEAGPYSLVFLDAADQEIDTFTRAFAAGGNLQPAGEASAASDPAFFTFLTPYPATAAKAQIRRNADSAVLAEVAPGASAPTVSINAPGGIWTGAQPLTWQAGGDARYFAVDVSTDGGDNWEALAIHLTGNSYTLETVSLPNTTQAYVRVAATDGFRTTTATAGPFTIDNPPLVGYVDPPGGATDVGIYESVYAGFRDAMNATTLNNSTFTLSGPSGSVPGVVTYDSETREATFKPVTPFAYSTTYTARLTTDIQDATGEALSAAETWTFTTMADPMPPQPLLLSPADGAIHVPRTTALVVLWDEALNAGTLDTTTFIVATVQEGTLVSGTVTYDAATHTLIFTPDAPLAAETLYIATLKAGIQDAAGNATSSDYRWAFTTGAASGAALRFTGAYGDEGLDSDGDGLYEQLIIRVGMQVTDTGSYVLRGTLADEGGGEITWAYITPTLTAGTHFFDLAFDGAAIGGHGVDGPYTLTDLMAHSQVTSQTLLPVTASQRDAYRTFAYAVDRFPSPLRFGGLPDVLLIPGTTALDAFDVRDYAQHATLSSEQLSYTVMLNANPRMSVTLQTGGIVHVAPEPYWEGHTAVTVRASDGVHAVQDTFEVTLGWSHTLYLPVVMRDYAGEPAAAARDARITLLSDDFESETLGWRLSSWIYNPPDGPGGWYWWDTRDCRAYSGQYSAWPYGGNDDGELLSCGAEYPNTLSSIMYKAMPVDLQYVAQGQYTAKVWTDLAPGAQVCLNVAVVESANCDGDWGPIGDYYGVCRSGQTDGWEDLTLDLANVPTLGSVLGEEHVCLAVNFWGGESGTRPEGAYVDDVSVQICPEGLTDYCELASTPAVTQTVALVAGNIGGYPGEVDEAALAVDASGHVHALWTGKLNPSFNDYVFYSHSDGVNWTPYQILSYWGGREPRIAVDNVHGRTHLAYGNNDGVVHHTVVNGVVSAPEVVAPRKTYYLPGFSLSSGGVAWPSLAVAEATGYAYLVWEEGYYAKTDAYTYQFRHRSWCATWDGAAWSAPLRKINDLDTAYSSIAAAPDGQTMMAWFQRWAQSSGGGTGPGDPIVARTAYGTEPGSFPLRQATHDLYPEPQRDESIVLAYSGGDDAFVLASDHLMWPGHSRVYRYVWQDGAWSEPLSVAENTAGWGVPRYIGAATDTPLIRYVYSDDWVLKTRTETNGVLSATQTIADYLSARGYSGTPLAYLADAAGDLHLVISGEKDGVAGFYYVQP